MRPQRIVDVIRLQRALGRSQAALRTRQEERLRALVRHAYRRVPYYRSLLDGLGLRPEDIAGLDDLPRLPLLSRAALQGAPPAAFLAEGLRARDRVAVSTSGTTGEPLKMIYRRRDWTVMNLTWVRAFLAAGMSPWQKRAAFVGRRDRAEGRQWYERLGLWRRLDVSTWLDPGAWVEAVRAFRPDALVGYAMTLRVFAEAVRASGAADVRPRFVFSTGGMLDEGTRRVLREVFGAAVIDVFASVEGGCLAWECPACGGYHVSQDTLIVEVLKDGRPARPGESGEAVITNLHSWAMPLLRYRSGDQVVVSEKEPVCGRRLALLSGLQGRINDCVVFASGERISSQPFYFAIQDVPGVRRWRVRQESIDRLLVEIAPGPEFDESSARAILAGLADLVRGRMSVELSRVASFPFDPDRKFRQVESRIGSPS